jgi:hypothetical protein
VLLERKGQQMLPGVQVRLAGQDGYALGTSTVPQAIWGKAVTRKCFLLKRIHLFQSWK